VKVSEAMTRDVLVANPDQSIREAAQMMVDPQRGRPTRGAEDRPLHRPRWAERLETTASAPGPHEEGWW
jgi:hypothetical protein